MEKESVLIIVGILVASTILLFGADWLGITGLQSSSPGPAQAPLDPHEVYVEFQKRMAERDKQLEEHMKEWATPVGWTKARELEKEREEILKEAIEAVAARKAQKAPNAPRGGGPQSVGSGPAN